MRIPGCHVRLGFADYVLDADRRELTHGSGAVAIGPQAFDVLLYLVLNRERVVSKCDLLESVWKGRIVSESTLTSHINAVRRAIGDDGEAQRWVRTIARKGFRFVGDVKEQPAVTETDQACPGNEAGSHENLSPSPALPDEPSIAVLPFLNLSGDPEQDYFTDGVVEDVIAALSRVRWLFVIARNSSFTYKGRSVDVRQVGRDLGVRYVLEGSLRKAADRVRISGQLIDAASGAHLWAEHFEGNLDNIFELQDRLAEAVAGAIAPQLQRAEIERAKRKPTNSLSAYDYYLRGMASLHRGTQQAIDEALPAFRKAIALDDEYASAYGLAAWCYFWRKVNGWSTEGEREIAEGTRLARAAIEFGKDDAVALARGGHALAHLTGDVDGGMALVDRALVLNPNLAAAWFLGAFLRVWRGDPDEAIERFTHAVRLSPLDPEMYRMQAGVAMAYLLAARPDAAAVWAEKACRELPTFLVAIAILAAAHAKAGRNDDARTAMKQVRKLNPELRLSTLAQWLPFQREQDLAVFADGLRDAGLPL